MPDPKGSLNNFEVGQIHLSTNLKARGGWCRIVLVLLS